MDGDPLLDRCSSFSTAPKGMLSPAGSERDEELVSEREDVARSGKGDHMAHEKGLVLVI